MKKRNLPSMNLTPTVYKDSMPQTEQCCLPPSYQECHSMTEKILFKNNKSEIQKGNKKECQFLIIYFEEF